MKSCKNCAHAEWQITKAGKLHPSGYGRCAYPIAIPKIPAAFYWADPPRPCGGFINRKKELDEHCVYFAWNDK